MSPDQAIELARKDQLPPVLLLVGEEAYLSQEVVRACKESTLRGGILGLNEDSFQAGSSSVESILEIARTPPMMAKKRWLLVRDVEVWDQKEQKREAKGDSKGKARPQAGEQLCDYADKPLKSTVLVLLAPKLDKRKKLYTHAKKQDYVVSCEALKRAELPGFVRARVQRTGQSISRDVAELIAELAGPELGAVADAVERASLYAGEGRPITEEVVSEVVVRLRTADVWAMSSAVGTQDLGACLGILEDLYSESDRGLPLIGTLAWATRQLLRYDEARKAGSPPAQAAQAAGVPPFKAAELEERWRKLSTPVLLRWLSALAQADLDLKGGSKRPPRASLEQMLEELCRS